MEDIFMTALKKKLIACACAAAAVTMTAFPAYAALPEDEPHIIYDSMSDRSYYELEYTSPTPTPAPTTPPTTAPVQTYTPSYVPSQADSGEHGWYGILDRINSMDEGTIEVDITDMNGTTNVPKMIFTALSGKNITLAIDMGKDIVWAINGNDVTEPRDIDLGVRMGAQVVPAKVWKKTADGKETVQIKLAHNGEFGLAAKLTLPFDSKTNGCYANLYWYDPETQTLELTDVGRIEDGKAELAFTHASAWAVVISDEPMSDDAGTEAGMIAEENSIDGQNGISVPALSAFIAAVVGGSAFAFCRKAKK